MRNLCSAMTVFPVGNNLQQDDCVREGKRVARLKHTCYWRLTRRNSYTVNAAINLTN